MTSKWFILGAGAIGNLWGCNLSYMNHPVTLILKNTDKLKQYQQAGKALTLNKKRYLVDAELADNNTLIEQLLITTKSTDTVEAVTSIKDRIAEHAKIIVLQNGMGTQQWVSDTFPAADVNWASTTDGAWLASPFTVVHAGKGVTRIGSITRSVHHADKDSWTDKLGCGFLAVEADEDIRATLWRKLAINCCINPLTATYHCKNGALIQHPEYLAEMSLIATEVTAVAASLGMSLFESPLIEQACQVAELTASNYSSMLQDVKHKRKTEIDYITGYLCTLAKKQGIAVPTNEKYLRKIKKIEDFI
ncbi:MAG: hypothetical protein CSA60_03840 [Neptuniibacter caesariensis]|uniref:2-dehydropantoate 2-reductase n=1 Tax=Neptuniibacter caesariensis TaxID=207954 RepID=A0A2G6JNB4_NEPCE|nr:MAG: hypothetical protein CSA60_03840 [Neptuniibacter caesariensis]